MNAVVKPRAVMADGLGEFRGKVLDTDAHAYLQPSVIREIIGEEVGFGFYLDFLDKYVGSEQHREHLSLNREELWDVKGIAALGANALGESDCSDRLEMLEMTGIRAQILFTNTNGLELRIDSDAARAACRRYNDYMLNWARPSKGRLRPVLPINMHRVDWAMAELERVLKAGAKVVHLPCCAPPGGVSPAHSVWDPFWAMLQEARVPATLHIGSGGLPNSQDNDPVIPPRGFANAESMKGFFANRVGGEEAIGPYFIMTSPLSAQLFCSSMVMGKVFERFPGLTLGMFEYGIGWVGPMAEGLDHHAELMGKVGYPYKMKPSEYIRRNVRVGPFFSENLPLAVQRYGMEEIYTFATDYPHLEGGRDPLGKALKWTSEMDPSYLGRYLVDNAAPMFPDLPD